MKFYQAFKNKCNYIGIYIEINKCNYIEMKMSHIPNLIALWKWVIYKLAFHSTDYISVVSFSLVWT